MTEEAKPLRWTAIIFYRTSRGLVDVHHDIDEIEDLDPIVEAGPDFGSIQRIEIRYNCGGDAMLTVEEAALL